MRRLALSGAGSFWLVPAAGVALVLGGWGLSRPAGAGSAAAQVEEVSAEALAARIARGEVVLVDVRTPEEFAEGHLAGAVNLPLDRFDPAALPRQSGRETILYCRSDRRSGIAAEAVAEALGQPVRHLDGGIVAWQAAGLPVTR